MLLGFKLWRSTSHFLAVLRSVWLMKSFHYITCTQITIGRFDQQWNNRAQKCTMKRHHSNFHKSQPSTCREAHHKKPHNLYTGIILSIKTQCNTQHSAVQPDSAERSTAQLHQHTVEAEALLRQGTGYETIAQCFWHKEQQGTVFFTHSVIKPINTIFLPGYLLLPLLWKPSGLRAHNPFGQFDK